MQHTEKRYYPFSNYLKNVYETRVHKIAIDAGLTCPNLDGTKAQGGCTYCNNMAFSHYTRYQAPSISEQIERSRAFIKKRFKAQRFMAYFQSYSNTYAPVYRLQSLYDQVLPYDDIAALSIATRPDCVSPAALNLLASYQNRFKEVWIEYGLQTVHNPTLRRINRKDTYERFLKALEQANERRLKICVHVMLGLPGETHAAMMQTAECLAALPFHSLKIHLLHVVRDTVLAEQYARGEFQVFSFNDYITTVCDFLERIPPHISIQRLTADAPPKLLIAPRWCLDRPSIYRRIDEELERRRSWQGQRCPAILATKHEPRPILT